jgi:hypothetical protein
MVKYRQDYDSVIVRAMISKDRSGQYSFTDIYNIVRKYTNGNPNVGKDTIQTHLNKMVKDQILVMLPKGGKRYNKTLYMLSPQIISWSKKTSFDPLQS